MSYLKKNSIKDFSDAWDYGSTLTLDELEVFDTVLYRLKKEFGENNKIVQYISEIRETYL